MNSYFQLSRGPKYFFFAFDIWTFLVNYNKVSNNLHVRNLNLNVNVQYPTINYSNVKGIL